MKAKEYLMKLKILDVKINNELETISALRASLTGTFVLNTTGEKIKGKCVAGNSKFVRTITKIDNMEHKVDKEIDCFVDEKHKFINQIQNLGNAVYIDILNKKYIEYEKYPNLETIAVKYNKSYSNIIRLHGEALEIFRKKYLV